MTDFLTERQPFIGRAQYENLRLTGESFVHCTGTSFRLSRAYVIKKLIDQGKAIRGANESVTYAIEGRVESGRAEHS